ncbi:hypothetical protein HZC34_01035 [Candidatus Saganbacteria bacterium]|nr:hypothetical protein [Candidatus Saganbacteria bacterium]
MKRVFALLVVLAFVATTAAPAFSAPAKKGMKKAAVKKVVKKAVKKVAPVAPVVTPPPPAPTVVTPPPPPAPVKVAPVSAAPAGLLGLGLKTAAEVGLVGGMMGVTGNIVLSDVIGLGPMIGLSDKAIEWKLGAGYVTGNDSASKSWRAVPVVFDGVINLPADMMGGIETFIGGGLNYVVTRSGSKAGTVGGQVYAGAQGDIGLGGKTYAELGYSIVKSGTTAPVHSSKSVSVLVGQNIYF